MLLLPDASSSTVGTMLRCTLDAAVRRDVLSVNEQLVMRTLGFSATPTPNKTPRHQSSDAPDKLVVELPAASGPDKPLLLRAAALRPTVAVVSEDGEEEEEEEEEDQASEDAESEVARKRRLSSRASHSSVPAGSPLSPVQAVSQDRRSSSAFSDIPLDSSHPGDNDDLDDLSVVSIGAASGQGVANGKHPGLPPNPRIRQHGKRTRRILPAGSDNGSSSRFGDESESPGPEESKGASSDSAADVESEGDKTFKRPRRRKRFSADLTCPNRGCGASFTRPSHLEAHLAGHRAGGGQMRHRCPVCAKAFPHERHLRDHLRYHRDRETATECPHCGRAFSGSRVLANHLRRAHDRVRCDLCGEHVVRKDLAAHARRAHPVDPETGRRVGTGEERAGRRFFCHVCKRGFAAPNALAKHKRSRHPDLREMVREIRIRSNISRCFFRGEVTFFLFNSFFVFRLTSIPVARTAARTLHRPPTS